MLAFSLFCVQFEPVPSIDIWGYVGAIMGASGPLGNGDAPTMHWSNATPIRAIFRQAFEGAGLIYFNPHSIRKALTRLGEQSCQTPEQFKAWSQNLGHERVLTTFTSYGAVRADRQ